MNVQLYSTNTVAHTQGAKLLVYGGSGTGKTSLAATCLDTNPIVASAERGLLSLSAHNIAATTIDNYTQLVQFHSWIFRDPSSAQFGTVFLDSATEIGEKVLGEELPKAGKEPRKAYNELYKHMTGLFRDFRDLSGRNVVFIAQEARVKDEGTGAMLYGPSFPGQKLAGKSPYFFDEVFRLFVQRDPASQQTSRVLQTQPDNQSDAKDRSGRLAPFEHANLSYIFRKLAGV